MSAPHHDLNLGDLLAWEPRFVWVGKPPVGWRERAVSWAVVARAGAPMLPPLHGGEIVLLPRAALEASGASGRGLGRELASGDPAAVVVDQPFASVEAAAAAGMPLLALPGVALTSELESTLNRMLAERRGALYRAGTELGRALTALAGREPDLDGAVEAASTAIGLPLQVYDRSGRLLTRRSQAGDDESPAGEDSIARPLLGSCRLVIGPVAPEARAGARLVADRIVHAINDVLLRAADSRPRGAARSEALAALLADGGGRASAEIEARARQIGLAVDATYRVALIHSDAPQTTPPEWLRAAGDVERAGRIADADAFVLTCRDLAGQCGCEGEGSGEELAAVSAPAFGVAALPEAARQARFVAQLLAAGSLPGSTAWFDRPQDVHAYGLLYTLWGSPVASRYAQDLLGKLRSRDRHGDLRATVRAFLVAGGSHVEAARRLGVHRNTLAYRLRQIDRALGPDWRRAPASLALHLALLIDDLPPARDVRPIPSAAAAVRHDHDWRPND